MTDDNPLWVRAVVGCLMDEVISDLKLKALVGSGLAALRANARIEDARQREADVRREKRRPEAPGSGYPDRRRNEDEHRAINKELANLEAERMSAGFGLFANLFGAIDNDPAQIVEPAHLLLRPGGAKAVHVRFWSVSVGIVVGVMGLATCRFGRSSVGRKVTGPTVPPPLPTPIAPPAPPVISRGGDASKPPPLPPTMRGHDSR